MENFTAATQRRPSIMGALVRARQVCGRRQDAGAPRSGWSALPSL